MIYEFKDRQGNLHEASYPMTKAPKIGRWYGISGVWCKRIASDITISDGVKRIVHQYPFRSESLPRGCAPESEDEKRRPIIMSQQHEKEVLARVSANSVSRGEPAWKRV